MGDQVTSVIQYWRSEKDGQWYWRRWTPNNRSIADGGGYNDEDNLVRGIREDNRFTDELIEIPDPNAASE